MPECSFSTEPQRHNNKYSAKEGLVPEKLNDRDLTPSSYEVSQFILSHTGVGRNVVDKLAWNLSYASMRFSRNL